MSDHSDILMLQRDITDLKLVVQKQEEEIAKLKELDTRRIRAALVVLGSMVLSMGAYIWAKIVEGK